VHILARPVDREGKGREGKLAPERDGGAVAPPLIDHALNSFILVPSDISFARGPLGAIAGEGKREKKKKSCPRKGGELPIPPDRVLHPQAGGRPADRGRGRKKNLRIKGEREPPGFFPGLASAAGK